MFNSTRKIIPALALFSLLAVSPTAFANDQAKLALAKKVVVEGDVSSYATPSFKNILDQAYEINDKIAAMYDDMGCELAEMGYLGYGNGDFGLDIRNWKANVTKSGMVRATFNDGGSSSLIEFDMICNGNKCLIDDVRHGYSTNPKVLPKHTEEMSLRQEAQIMVDTNDCAWGSRLK